MFQFQVFSKVIHSHMCLVPQSCPTFCDPRVCSPPGPSVHGILQARIVEWVAISFSRGSFLARDATCVSRVSCIGRWVLYLLSHQGSPILSLSHTHTHTHTHTHALFQIPFRYRLLQDIIKFPVLFSRSLFSCYLLLYI